MSLQNIARSISGRLSLREPQIESCLLYTSRCV